MPKLNIPTPPTPKFNPKPQKPLQILDKKNTSNPTETTLCDWCCKAMSGKQSFKDAHQVECMNMYDDWAIKHPKEAAAHPPPGAVERAKKAAKHGKQQAAAAARRARRGAGN